MSKTFPTPNSIVCRHHSAKKNWKKTTNRLNRVISFLYRTKILPLFGAGRSLIIIENFGRKTGKQYLNPTLCYPFYTNIWTVYVAKGKKADWIKNILASKDQKFSIYKGFRKITVKMRFVEDEEERYKHLVYFCKNYRSAKEVFGYNRRTDEQYLDTPEFRNILNYIEFIQLEEVE